MSDLRPSTLVEHSYRSFALNHHLLDRQDCWDNLDDLIKTHKEKLDIYERMDKTLVENKKRLVKLADEVKQKEFKLQKLWGFPQDASFHDWYKVPHCSCPKMDNGDYKGTKYAIFSGDCPIHGGA